VVEDPETDVEPEREYTSSTEKFLDKYFVKELMSKEGRITVMAIYFVLTIFSLYGASKLEVDFSIEYFVDDGSYIKNYLDANK
jgi:predicted RND superfamily exporter protein